MKSKWIAVLEQVEKRTRVSEGTLQVNVGGQLFFFSERTTSNVKAKSVWFDKLMESCARDPHSGPYFVDRDPTLFARIAYFLHSSEWNLSGLTSMEEEFLQKEAYYFGLDKFFPVDLVYRSDFDENGLTYWLGTNKGRQSTFSNPCGNEQLIKATESEATLGNARVAFGREKTSNYIGSPGGWFQIELRTVSIIPDYYTLRNNSSASFAPRNWVLKGSDGSR
eukprot:TRINITY_DN15905_c0_g1_i1.p1 TRINITY_DN15905_c0_g1~~TRINITY_DN15905_c0_g1_i1.p1  ORF type:complete len:222 (+),score=31.29 TRINITY_DN15905_c0_g1_i1:344-1009(+)